MKDFTPQTGRADCSAFISHMVQMKGWDSQTEPEPNPTLYPTWFRWKQEQEILEIFCSNFISHMVQMKVL